MLRSELSDLTWTISFARQARPFLIRCAILNLGALLSHLQSESFLRWALDELHVAHLLTIDLTLLSGGVHQAVGCLHVDIKDPLFFLFIFPEADICARSLAIDRILVGLRLARQS